MEKGKVIITGANGQLGQELNRLSSAFPGLDFVFLSKENLSIHDTESVRNTFKKYQPAFCINCAAYTAVDKAETEKDLAKQINADAVGVLAAVCNEYGSKFVHISTDYVFDGTATTPYKADASTNPQSVYGATKLEGEKLAMKSNPDSIIIRTSWVYSEFGKNFVKTMMRLMSDKESINVVEDQVGSPTYAADLAEAILQIISSGKWKAGIYHYSNTGIISWYDFAIAIKELTGCPCKVNPIPSSQYPTPAKRPGYSALDTSAIATTFDLQLKEWKKSLSACVSRLKL
ncbi:MAG: dTDP-4-dehydrorhamnose reductase [Chitinophagaceae bacterium]